MSTIRLKANQIRKEWHVIDAADRPLGRVASDVARLLRGKHKPTFEPHLDVGDFVVVVNAANVRLSGKKRQEKVYYRHSGYPGGLKWRSFEEELAKHPDRVIRRAVWGMLPKNSLGRLMLAHLKVYPGPDHPHQAQVIGSERERQRWLAQLPSLVREDMAKKPPRLRPLRGHAEFAPEAFTVTAQPAPSEDAPQAEEPRPVEAAAPADTAPRPRSRRTKAATAQRETPPATAEAPQASEEPSPRRRTRTRRAADQPASEIEE